MPSFVFTSPDGKSYTVNGPEGATAEQAFAILQQQLGAQKPAAAPVAEAAPPPAVAKEPEGEGILSGIGRVAGDIAKQFAAPAAAAPFQVPRGVELGIKGLARQSMEGQPEAIMPSSVYQPGLDTEETLFGPETEQQRAQRKLQAQRAVAAVPSIPGAETLSKIGDDVQKSIQGSLSKEGKKALRDSQITGNIFKGEIDFGKNPTVEGYALQVANVFGSMAAPLATTLITKSPGAGGAVGGGMAADEAGKSAAEYINKLTDDQLSQNSPLYAELIAGGASPKEARELTIKKAAETGAALQGLVATFGDVFTGKLVTGQFDNIITKLAGKTKAGRAAGAATVGGTEESLQETLEGLASDVGIKTAVTSKELGEDSAANLVMGFVGGAGPGGVRGLIAKEEAPPAPEKTAEDIAREKGFLVPMQKGQQRVQPPAPPKTLEEQISNLMQAPEASEDDPAQDLDAMLAELSGVVGQQPAVEQVPTTPGEPSGIEAPETVEAKTQGQEAPAATRVTPVKDGSVRTLFDPEINSYVTQRMDAEGNQIGDTSYDGTPEGASISHQEMIDASKPKGQASNVVRSTDLPDGMQTHVFKTAAGYGSGLYDTDSGQYVNGSIRRFTGQTAETEADKYAAELGNKATPVAPTDSKFGEMNLEDFQAKHPKPYTVTADILKTDITKMSDEAVLGQYGKNDLVTLAKLLDTNTSGTKQDLLANIRKVQANRERMKNMTPEQIQAMSVEQLRGLVTELGGNPAYKDKETLAKFVTEWRDNSLARTKELVAESNHVRHVVQSVKSGNQNVSEENIKRYTPELWDAVDPDTQKDLYEKLLRKRAIALFEPPFMGVPTTIVGLRDEADRTQDPKQARKLTDLADKLQGYYDKQQKQEKPAAEEEQEEAFSAEEVFVRLRNNEKKGRPIDQDLIKGMDRDTAEQVLRKYEKYRKDNFGAAHKPTDVTKALEDHLATLPERDREAEYTKTMTGVKAKAAREKQERGEELTEKEKTDIAKQDLEDALGDLSMLMTKGTRLNIVPEQEQKLIPILTKLMDAAFRMGYYEFKRAAKFVMDTIRSRIGKEVADQIDLKHLQGAYIAMSGKYEDEGASPIMEVASVKSLEELEEEPVVAAEEEPEKKPFPMGVSTKVVESIRDHLLGGEGFKTIIEARKFIEKLRNTKIEPGTPEAKEADELIEAGVVMAAQEIIKAGREQGRSSQVIYDRLVDLYSRQPNLSVRDSTSIANQAYSTPAPLAFVASELAGINDSTTVYEPTAGNGMLLIGANPDLVTANELDRRRFDVLRSMFNESDAEITLGNALEQEFEPSSFDVVIENPPFGKVGDISNIDHDIADNSLRAMKEDGRAVLILGGVQANTEDGRREGYRAKAKREFYYRLYSTYNVVDHFTVGGNMYAKQGTTYPVDVIVIDGVGKSKRDLPAADLPQLITSYDQLKEKLNEPSVVSGESKRPSGTDVGAGAEGQAGREGVAAGAGRPGGGAGTEGGRPAGGVEPGVSEAGAPAGGQPGTTGSVTGAAQPGAEDVSKPVGGRGPVAGAGEQAAGERKGRTEGSGSGGLGGVSVVSGERVGSGLTDRAGQEQETAGQVTYNPLSNANSVGTLVPRAMADSIQQSLEKVEAAEGNLDEYVARSLEMDPETVRELFSAEQVDALALSIRNAEAGKGFIIGDQTGIGKGRVVAAMIRYALVNDKIPIFVTEKPNLYSDMIRDLDDIGMTNELGLDTAKPKILITNQKTRVPYTLLRTVNGEITENNLVLGPPKTGAAMDGVLKKMQEDDSLGDYKVIFTTYSQLQTYKGKQTERMRFVSHFGAGNYMIFDESHNAGGAGETQARTKEQREKAKEGESLVTGRAAFVRNLVRNAFGTFFSSATYAKRPDVMDLYSSTDMKLAVNNLSELSDAIKNGGIPMQQAVAQMLAQVGQYIRRERTFAGVSYDTQETKVDKTTAENMATSMRDILAFSRMKEAVVKGIQKDFDKQGAKVSEGGEKTKVQSANFGAIMHNLIDQMLLSLKAQDSVRHAIARLKAGEKVVMTVSNTMGSFLKDYADEMDLSAGDKVDLSFADLYTRYLDKQRVIKIKHPGGRIEEYRLTDQDLGPDLVDEYNRIRDFIENAGFGSAPISPIDYMHAELRKAKVKDLNGVERNVKTEEITGRTMIVSYETGTPVLASRSSSIRQRVNAVKAFNNGKADVIILNQAGSTGLSLHASSKVKDQRKRHMIIVQPEKNIDTHMQMLGRVHRTGQVIPPAYSQMMADIPAEMRPAAVLLKKMASLNANTTASRKSAVTAEGAVDFMNDYGGQVVNEYLRDNPEVHQAIGGKSVVELSEDPSEANEDDIRKFTGYVPILPIKQQEEIYKDLIDRYNDLIQREDSMGTNKLEAKASDLDARTIDSQQITEDKGDPSVFAQPAFMEKVDVKRTVKPLSKEEVQEQVKENLKGMTVNEFRNLAVGGAKDRAAIYGRDKKAEMEAAAKPDPVAIDKFRNDLQTQYNHVKTVIDTYPIGTPVSIKNTNGVFVYGVVTNIESKGKTKNPVAGSDWKMTLALANGDAKSITLNFSQIGATYTLAREDEVQWLNPDTLGAESIPLTDLFDKGATVRREKRWMVTGNILAGYAAVGNMGQIMTYTKDDGTTAQGILMPRTFDFEKQQKNAPVKLGSVEKVMAFFDKFGSGAQVSTENGVLKIQQRGSYYKFTAPSSKREGGTYYLDTGLTRFVGSFTKSGSIMATTVYKNDLEQALRYITSERGESFVAVSNKDEAREAFQVPLKNVMPDAEMQSQNPDEALIADRDDMIARYAKLRQRRAQIMRKYEKGQGGLTEQQEMQELKTTLQELKRDIDTSKPERRSAKNFFTDATKAWDRGDISDDVYAVIETLYKKFPFVLEQLKLSVTKTKDGSAAGEFFALPRIVRLYKGTNGVTNPSTARHEIVHSLEQMMSSEAAMAVAQDWFDKLDRAFKNEKTPKGLAYFSAVLEFLENPSEATYAAALAALPSYEYYQYLNPSEYWAVNAEKLMARKLGSGWDRFVLAVKKLYEGLKNLIGFDNQYTVHKVFDDIMNARAARVTKLTINDYIGTVSIPLANVNTRRNYKGGPAPLSSWDSVNESKLDNFVYKVADKHIDTKRVQEAITNEIGDISDNFDLYMKEELYHGRTAKQVTDFLKDELQPLIKDMVKAGVTMEEFSGDKGYLHNRAAHDRNVLIAARNASMPDAGSGVYDQEATDYMANLDPAKRKVFEALAAKIDDIVRGTQDLLVSSGLEKAETIDMWREREPNYVPLNRDPDELDFVSASTGMGKGFSTRGSSTRTAAGSLKTIEDVLGSIALQRERAIVRAEKARVGRALYGLAISSPNPDFWMPINPAAIKNKKKLEQELVNLGLRPDEAENIIQEPRVSQFDKATGQIRYRVNPAMRNSENVFAVRINGEDRFIFFNPGDPRALRMVQALKNLDAEQLSGVMGITAELTRTFAALNTQYNPVFGAWNFARDSMGAAINLNGTPLENRKLEVFAGAFPALRAIYRDLREKGSTTPEMKEWIDLFERYQNAGGQTGYREQFSRSKEKATIVQRELDNLNAGNARKAAKAVFDWLSDYNDAMENAVRLSAFKAALDEGMSEERAASLAKNLTVNFNRKGQAGTWIGALFAFFNASVQGTARMAKLLVDRTPDGRYKLSKHGKRIIAGGMAIGVAQAVALAMAGFGEDDPPEFLKNKNIIIPSLTGSGNYLIIPMPLGLNVFPNVGRTLTEFTMSSRKDVGKLMGKLFVIVLDSFNPLGSSGLAQTIAPTIIDPFVALSENKDAFGRPISRESRATNPTPGYERNRESATAVSKGLSYALNYLTGGGAYGIGAVSPTADQIDYLAGQYAGGVGREVMKAARFVGSIGSKDEIPPYKVPILGKLYGETTTPSAVTDKFYKNVIMLAEHEGTIKRMRTDKASTQDYKNEYPETRLINRANRLENQISQLNRTIKEIGEKPETEFTKDRIKRLKDQKTRMMTKFNEDVKKAAQ